MVTVSFEFFPPATPVGRDRLAECAAELARFGPAFMSVTYGAGGTSQDRTLDALGNLVRDVDVPIAGHLTTVGATKDDIHRVIDRYVELGIEHIVALRGDPVQDATAPTAVGYETAADLVTAIRSRPDGDRFEISVAAYPEVHPKATSAEADLDNLKRKIDAGADRAITQFFFDTDVFLAFRDQVAAAGVEAPIVPGVMPVTNFSGITRFADRCGAIVPEWLTPLLADLDDDPEVQQPVAAAVAAEQCRRLVEGGVDEFHFYTMNRRALPATMCRTLGLAATPVTP